MLSQDQYALVVEQIVFQGWAEEYTLKITWTVSINCAMSIMLL